MISFFVAEEISSAEVPFHRASGRTDGRTDGLTTRVFVYVNAESLIIFVQTEDWNRSRIKMCSQHSDVKNYSQLER